MTDEEYRAIVAEARRERRLEQRIGYVALVVAVVLFGVLLWFARQPVSPV